MKTIAFVPMKLKNERLPGKNTKPFTHGKPLCKYILETLKKNLERIRQREARMREAYLEGIDTKEEYRRNKELLQKERAGLEDQIVRLDQAASDKGSGGARMIIPISSILDILKSDQFTMQEKNTALKSIVERIVFDKGSLHIDVDYYLPESLL